MTYIPKQKELHWVPKRKPRKMKIKTKSDIEPFYNTRDWRDRLRVQYLNEFPFCVECEKQGKLIEAKVVDHIIPISQGGSKRDARNYQGLCTYHHNRKRGQERHGIVQEFELNHNGEKIPKQ